MYQMIVEIVKKGMSRVVVSQLYQSFMFLNKEIVSGIMIWCYCFILCYVFENSCWRYILRKRPAILEWE